MRVTPGRQGTACLLILVTLIVGLPGPQGSTQSSPSLTSWVEEPEGPLEPGDLVPDFVLPNSQMEAVQLSSFKGDKAVFLISWRYTPPSPYAPPIPESRLDILTNCLTFPQQLYPEYRERGVEFLVIHDGPRTDAAAAWLAEKGIELTVLWDAAGQWYRKWGLPEGYPYFVAVTRNGRVAEIPFHGMNNHWAAGIAQLRADLDVIAMPLRPGQSPSVLPSYPEVGQVLPDFTLQTLDGQTISTERVGVSKALFIVFWDPN